MTALDILNKNIDKQAQTKLGIQYTQKMKRAALESMQEYADQQLILSGVSHSKNLTLLETIENTKQLPQVQYNLQRQLRELRVMSNKLGLYDAADFLTSYCG